MNTAEVVLFLILLLLIALAIIFAALAIITWGEDINDRKDKNDEL